jgi:hypothetical protein
MAASLSVFLAAVREKTTTKQPPIIIGWQVLAASHRVWIPDPMRGQPLSGARGFVK